MLAYHVDLVVYAYENKDEDGSQIFLARGKESVPDEIMWEKSDPLGLIDYINNTITDEKDREQFRRIVRYFKRWKNLKFESTGNSEPPSIGITLCILKFFEASKTYDYLEKVYRYGAMIVQIAKLNI